MNIRKIVRIAFRALLEGAHRKAPNPEGAEHLLKTNLLLRESTGISSKWASARQREAG